MNALHTEMNRQHDQAHVEAQALRRQALAGLGGGCRQPLTDMAHLTWQGVQRLAAQVMPLGRRNAQAQPQSRS